MKILSFIKKNLSAIITLVAGVGFLLVRLAFPDYVSGNVADVLLLITLPMFVIIFSIIYKLDDQNIELDNYKREIKSKIEESKLEIFETLGYRFRLFQSKQLCDIYYENKISSSKIIKDLTWAEVNSQNFNISKDYINHIRDKQDYQEIFIFAVNGRYRNDRLIKLKLVYEFIKKYPDVHLNYSCSYYPEVSFERLQYTIFDEKEVLFTSSYAQRCSLEEAALVSIFNKYFDQAWKEARPLIENGVISDEETIIKLIQYLPK
jgi:hypothetical protein